MKLYDRRSHLIFEGTVEEYLQIKNDLPEIACEPERVDFSEIPVILDENPLTRIERWIAYRQSGYSLFDSNNMNPPEKPEIDGLK